ncbi:hypothetical protein [Synoicihabitans lomoniglobus]|uniref:Uncharacterized protein n=1 Tax=Synoicihabitans lomoniglobus TaxID=2909285 RepID=A0AAF0I5S6_9BACT|nr:hypothetical protein [Opitutaceae bacterium LMO-M01]WED67185.1 hypothetical protein PXH66_10005 [Opitutaceae bacterium LMO-M01]
MSSPSDNAPSSRKPGPAALIGVGLDNEDGHKRITRGEKFALIGGSQETHERMTETTLKTFEELKRRDKQLENVDRRELAEIIDKSTPR